MNTRILRGLICSLGVGLAGICLAAGNGIYQRETAEGALELSNLTGDEEGELLVAPAAPEVTSLPAAPPTAAARVLRPALQSAQQASLDTGNESDTANQQTQAAVAATPVGVAGSPVTDSRDSMAASSAMRVYPGTVSTLVSGTDGSNAQAPTDTVAAVSGPSVAKPVTAPVSVLDSPTALSARLAQYRDLMLNEPLLANGQPANPAITRRYKMVNKGNYVGGN